VNTDTQLYAYRRHLKKCVYSRGGGRNRFLPLPPSVKMALDVLPLPRNAAQDCPYYFWNGVTSQRAVVGIAERALAAVFKKSGVKNAHAHRYRHTLATRLRRTVPSRTSPTCSETPKPSFGSTTESGQRSVSPTSTGS
jgi:integrase